MLRHGANCLSLCLLLFCARVASADIAPVARELQASGRPNIAQETPTTATSADAEGDFSLARSLSAQAPIAADWAENLPSGELRELPPLPGSLSLFLSAAFSIGAWQVVRATRGMHLGALPDWYHESAPAQIGHTVVFDFTFAGTALCSFEAPPEYESCSYLLHRPDVLRLQPQSDLAFCGPRGPPIR